MESYYNMSYEDLCALLIKEEEYLVTLALCPEGVNGEAFKYQQEIVDAIYEAIEWFQDLYR